jgi:hypothetical protein
MFEIKSNFGRVLGCVVMTSGTKMRLMHLSSENTDTNNQGILEFPIMLSKHCYEDAIYSMAGKSASLLNRRTPVKRAVQR